jgi:SpoVK/Ycf46/Vps4 family AAA+-type ATPase
VVATANDVSSLPPELLRKGRFDEIFFVDLPTVPERKDIFKVHLSKRRFNPAEYDVEKLAQVSAGFSGAEIEQAIISAMFDVFYEKKKLSSETLLESIVETVPLSKTMGEDIDHLRDWAQGRARFATSPEVEKNKTRQRDIEI